MALTRRPQRTCFHKAKACIHSRARTLGRLAEELRGASGSSEGGAGADLPSFAFLLRFPPLVEGSGALYCFTR